MCACADLHGVHLGRIYCISHRISYSSSILVKFPLNEIGYGISNIKIKVLNLIVKLERISIMRFLNGPISPCGANNFAD